MDQPLFSDSQFLDQNALNTAFGLSYSSAQQITDLTNSPGLINPSSMGITLITLTIRVSVPSPFAVLFGNGALATGNGTTDGAISSNYMVDMTPLIPGSGSVTAYVVATFAQISENSYEVIGPPSGHPDFSPTFAAYQAYSDVKDTLSITATTTAPNNLTTFELCRTTLTAGQTSITTVDTAHWVFASSILAPTGVNAGSYAGATVTVGVDGRITGIASVAYQAPLGFTPVQQGGGTGQLNNKVFLGWDGVAPRIQIDAVDQGHIGMVSGTNTWTGTNEFAAGVSASFYSTAASILSFVGGPSGIVFANHANTVGNLSIVDNGDVSVRGNASATTMTTTPPVASDNSTRVITSSWIWNSFAFFAQATGFAITGSWVRFPSWLGGFMMQWGSVVVGTGRVVVDLPTAFPNSTFWSGCSYGSDLPPTTGACGSDPANSSQIFIANTAPSLNTIFFIAVGN